MAFGFSKPRLSPIAIDFGAGSIKLLQVVPTDPAQLVAAAAAVVPEQARREPAARSAFLEETLRSLLKSGSFKGRRVVLSFPAFQTLMQHLEMPRVEGEDAESQLGLALRSRLHIDPARVVVRQFPVRQFHRDGVKLDEVICLAAAREVVTGYLDLAHRLKLDVAGMHSEPLALLKAFEHCYRDPAAAGRVCCYIDIGAALTKVVIAHGTRLVFAKSIHAAGDQLTRALAKERSCDFMEAYRARCAGGADAMTASAGTAVAAAGSADRPGLPPDDIVETIVDELRLCLRYHASIFPEKRVERLVFVGGEARNLGLCQAIARGVQIAAQLGDPFARLTRLGASADCVGVDPDQPQPGWSVAMGLCLSEAPN